MQIDLTSINIALTNISKKISEYLNNIPKIDFADYDKQQDIKYISNKYNEIVQYYSNLLNLIIEVQYFISQCKKLIRLISDNSSLEKNQKTKLKIAIDTIEELSQPLYTEKERLKTIEMFYRNLYTRKDF